MGVIRVEVASETRATGEAARRAYELAIAAGATPDTARDLACAKYRVFRPDVSEIEMAALIDRLVPHG